MFLKLTNVSGKPLKVAVTVRHAKGARVEAETTEIELAEGQEIDVERTANGFEIAAEDLPVQEPAAAETETEDQPGG